MEVLGFAKKADVSNGPFRWLTVASPEEPDGTELQLALNDNPCSQGVSAGDLRITHAPDQTVAGLDGSTGSIRSRRSPQAPF
jgi:hypothetical protein